MRKLLMLTFIALTLSCMAYGQNGYTLTTDEQIVVFETYDEWYFATARLVHDQITRSHVNQYKSFDVESAIPYSNTFKFNGAVIVIIQTYNEYTIHLLQTDTDYSLARFKRSDIGTDL